MLFRSISSPQVPRVGVDLVFLDGAEGDAYFNAHLDDFYGGSKPISTVLLDARYKEALEESTPGSLERVAEDLLKQVHSRN